MKGLLTVLLLSLLSLAACLTPTAADFKGKNSPLTESEFLVTWRVPLTPGVHEVQDTSEVFLAKLEASMRPIREQLIPRIYDDLVKGNLTLYLEEEIQNLGSAKTIELSSGLERLPDWSGEDISDLSNVFHFSQRRVASKKGMDATEMGLSLIWRDAENNLPERPLGTVMFSDLDSLGYSLVIDGVEVGIMEFLEENKEFIFPIQFFTLEKQSWGLMTLAAAFGSKEYVVEGKWSDLEWLENVPNLTDFSLEKRSKSELQLLEGEYVVNPGQDETFTTGEELITVTVEAYDQSLWTRWSNKHEYFAYLMFPTKNNQFFSGTGEVISFQPTEGGGNRMIILTPDGETITGESN